MKYFDDIMVFFERNGIKKPVGCKQSEIDALEVEVGFTLPEVYKEYLLFMGRDYKGVLKGTDCFIDDAISNTKYLPELLGENKIVFKLPENYLAFFCHQGYIISWFALPCESDNPVCYFFSEGTTENPIEYGRLKQLITKDILDNVKIEIELRATKKWWQVWR